jgi:K+-transporting ATPase ATPase C chain
MFRHLKQAILATIVLTLVLGIGYPLAMSLVAGKLFPYQAHGSLIVKDDKVVGSELIGQTFTSPIYFHGRPSATTDTDPNDSTKTIAAPYNAGNSGGSNAAPSSKALISDIEARVQALKAENPDAAGDIPVDLVTASGSGLDPHISLAAALYQVPRVAKARNMDSAELTKMVRLYAEGRTFGLLGEPRVNVLRLNLGLDASQAK